MATPVKIPISIDGTLDVSVHELKQRAPDDVRVYVNSDSVVFVDAAEVVVSKTAQDLAVELSKLVPAKQVQD